MFVLFPFIIPKATGESRLIFDYSHLWGKYVKPQFRTPAFPAVPWYLKPVQQGDYMARIDLKVAFYAIPLLKAIEDVTAFRYKGKTYTFKVLPMGLFVSPAILQAIVQESVRRVIPLVARHLGHFAWVHLDDILLIADNKRKLHDMVVEVMWQLHVARFNIALKKSQLQPPQKLNYCGLQDWYMQGQILWSPPPNCFSLQACYSHPNVSRSECWDTLHSGPLH